MRRNGKRARRGRKIRDTVHSKVNAPMKVVYNARQDVAWKRKEKRERRRNVKATHDQLRGPRNYGRRSSQLKHDAKPVAQDYDTHKKRLAQANRSERKKAKSVTGRAKQLMGVWKPTYYAHPNSKAKTNGHLHPAGPSLNIMDPTMNIISGDHETNEAALWNANPGKKKYLHVRVD